MEQQLESNSNGSNEKKPTFLVFLAVLSFISIAFSLFGALMSFFSGPLSEEAMEEQRAVLYDSIATLQSQGMDGFAATFEKSLQYAEYMNFEAFYLGNVISLLVTIIGLVAVIMMLKLKKIGFHLYVAYSLLPVITMYLITPMELITTFSVVTTLIISAIFCLLYGLNLKHMK
tara:strand:+ start:35184 stop:35702 length:519 start_codon:yes stop_codon:yes gene_type:complete